MPRRTKNWLPPQALDSFTPPRPASKLSPRLNKANQELADRQAASRARRKAKREGEGGV